MIGTLNMTEYEKQTASQEDEKMAQPYCYKITLPTTDSLEVNAKIGGRYIDTERGGIIYYIASTLGKAAARFPNALLIERLGMAIASEEKTLDTKCQTG
jgi:hypothetical protein